MKLASYRCVAGGHVPRPPCPTKADLGAAPGGAGAAAGDRPPRRGRRGARGEQAVARRAVQQLRPLAQGPVAETKGSAQGRQSTDEAAARRVRRGAFISVRRVPGLPRLFVVLPAVYGEVYAQALAQATEEHVSIRGVEVADDIDPKTGKLRMRSRVVMNVGALAFMGALMVGGAVRAPLRIAAACLPEKWGSSRANQRRRRRPTASPRRRRSSTCRRCRTSPTTCRRTPTTCNLDILFIFSCGCIAERLFLLFLRAANLSTESTTGAAWTR